MIRITKKIEFDAGHRIPSHASKCRNMHGHRYVCEATLEGDVKPVRGESDDGMVLDFGGIKEAMMDLVHDKFDHGFIVYEGDLVARGALKMMDSDSHNKQHKTIVVPFVPTAENLSEHIFDLLDTRFTSLYNGSLRLTRVRLYETPTGWADTYRSPLTQGEEA